MNELKIVFRWEDTDETKEYVYPNRTHGLKLNGTIRPIGIKITGDIDTYSKSEWVRLEGCMKMHQRWDGKYE